MKVLLLSPYSEKLIPVIKSNGDSYMVSESKIDLEFCILNKIQFIVSYGFRHLISKEICDYFPLKVINLHIGYLPLCKGSHPIFWAIAENNITGVTIHLVDEGLDTGNILFQKEINYLTDNDTFKSAYKIFSLEIERLFNLNWKYIRNSENKGWIQNGEGSSHRKKDIDKMKKYLPFSWGTSIKEFYKLSGKKNHYKFSSN